ncbi:MAG: hydroxypyruvate reductase [Rhodobacteraceae bacterium]|nr:MAG: hydroxypyruvate reductase [Paracoccaceae bacterium]
MIPDPATFLRQLFDRAVEVADPMRSLAGFLPEKPKGRLIVIGAGKASARMAEAVEAVWGPCVGLVITRYGYGRPCKGIEIVEAAHPVPDQAGVEATQRMLQLVQGLTEDDFVLALISGGASALLCAPAQDMTLAEKQAVNAALLASGAPISAMNTVRKHVSRVKGGQLAAAAYPAHMLALMISDVPGDDPAFIGSGPTVGDATTPDEVRAILDRWAIPVPDNARVALDHSGVIPPGDPRLSRTENVIYAAPAQSLAAAAAFAAPFAQVRTLGDSLEGEARVVARDQAARAIEIAAQLKPGDRPVLLLSGGELTVTRRGDGIGGPNAEFCLALALALDGHPQIHAIACDTDGVDGAAEVAGALVSPTTLQIPGAAEALSRNDAHSYFSRAGAQVVTGPTLTNVNDFRAILVLPPD